MTTINPLTGRTIKIGSSTYLTLIKNGILSDIDSINVQAINNFYPKTLTPIITNTQSYTQSYQYESDESDYDYY